MSHRLLPYLAALLGAVGRVCGQETVWTGDDGPDWFAVLSWAQGTPTGDKVASIPMGSVKIQRMGAATNFLKLDGAIEIDKDQFSLGNDVGSLAAWLIEIGYVGYGSLTLKTGGRIDSSSVTIGARGGTKGTAVVDGATDVFPGGAVWNNSGNFFVGSGAIGESLASLEIVNGGILNCDGEPGGGSFVDWRRPRFRQRASQRSKLDHQVAAGGRS